MRYFSQNTQLKKHLVLKRMYDYHKSCPNHWHSASKGFEVKTFESNFDFDISEELLESLILEGYITSGKHYWHTSKDMFYLTTLGRKTYLGKTLLNSLWYRSRDFWMAVVAILISIVALFRSS